MPGIRQKSASIGVGSDQAGKVAAALAMAAQRARASPATG